MNDPPFSMFFFFPFSKTVKCWNIWTGALLCNEFYLCFLFTGTAHERAFSSFTRISPPSTIFLTHRKTSKKSHSRLHIELLSTKMHRILQELGSAKKGVCFFISGIRRLSGRLIVRCFRILVIYSQLLLDSAFLKFLRVPSFIQDKGERL